MKYQLIICALILTLSACTLPAEREEVTTSPNTKEIQSSSVSTKEETADQKTEQQAPLLRQQTEVKSSSSSSKDLKTEILLSTNTPIIGETMTIRVTNAKKVSAKTNLGFIPRFFEEDGDMVALLPISYSALPGNYTLDITADTREFHHTLVLKNREFEVQHLTVDPSTTAATAGSAKANAEWETKVEPLKAVADGKKHWNGTFIQPVQGSITTEYGSIRYTNGSSVASRHSGIDIAAKADTPILATGNGRVIFSDFLQLTGNTVVIEHGYGLKSFYYHMNSLSVEEGDNVKQGIQIGAVGSTGFSTGAHLHFAMSVNNIFTNPWTMMESGIE